MRILARRRVLHYPLSNAVLLAFHKVTTVRRPIGPHVLALSLEESVCEISYVLVTIGKLFTSMTVS